MTVLLLMVSMMWFRGLVTNVVIDLMLACRLLSRLVLAA